MRSQSYVKHTSSVVGMILASEGIARAHVYPFETSSSYESIPISPHFALALVGYLCFYHSFPSVVCIATEFYYPLLRMK
jgi:hypothetical protein